MKIVAFSINPLFPGRVMGGAPKQLQKIVVHLGELGHDVTVLCAQRADSKESFHWHPRVQVKPLLRFKQPFPQPYDTPAYHIANAFQDVAEHLADADRFYMHDGELLFPPVYQHMPTVVSLRDNVYPETMLGGFLFQGDALIAISEYSRQFYLHTSGRFYPQLAERLLVVHNGFDWDHYRPTPPGRVLDIIRLDPTKYDFIIHPHRPEPSKGLSQTIQVVERLVNQFGLKRVMTLVPLGLEEKLSLETRRYYQSIRAEIAERGLTGHFHFHGWIPLDLMPAYYSLGEVTLALGNFVESFGNTPYESLGCGTPAVVSRVSTHRELLPDDLLDKVDYGDVQTAAQLVAQMIQNRKRTRPETLAYLHAYFPVQKQLDGYARAILDTPKQPPLAYHFQPRTTATRYKLAPWCVVGRGGIYHDFLAQYHLIPPLEALVNKYPDGFSVPDGFDSVLIEIWYRDGFIVPVL